MSRTDLLNLTDEELVGATSVGLVRRARKELDDPALSAVVTAAPDAVAVEWSDGAACRFEPGSYLHGRCTCPSLDICRHLVRSVLFLQRHPDLLASLGGLPELPPQKKSREYPTVDELLAADSTQFDKRIGKASVRKAKKMLAGGIPVRVSNPDRREVAFPSIGVTIRFPAGASESFSVCNCSESAPCSHVVPALLVLRGDADREAPTKEIAPEDRADLDDAMGRTQSLLGDLVRMGLDGLSIAWSEAATTTALEIKKLGLGVPAELLEQLAGHVEAEISRRGQPDPSRLRWLVAALSLRLNAWSSGAAKNAEDDLIARPGQAYWTAGARTLVGVGARAWSNDDVAGITVYLLDLNTRQVVTTGTARPKEYEMSAESLASSARLLADYTARDLIGDHFTTSAARLTTGGKIRIPPDAICQLVAAPVSWEVLLHDYGVAKWSSLADRLAESFPMLVSMHRPLVHWFVPKSFWPAKVDAQGQQFLWPMLDESGRVLTIAYRYSAERADAFAQLRKFADAAQPLGVLGSLRWTAGEARVEPITFIHRLAGQAAAFVVDIDRLATKSKKRRGKKRTNAANAIPTPLAEWESPPF